MSWMVRHPDERRAQRSRLWRRRVLLKKGARLHAQMRANADDGSLAMLDEEGMVISWYNDRAEGIRTDLLLEHHVSQFYLSNDVALGVPMRDLCTAVIHGVSKQLGWRRTGDGSIGWAMTQIEAELLADGRLQGFVHVIRRSPGGAEARSDVRQPLEVIHCSSTDPRSTDVDRLAASLELGQQRYSMSATA